MLVERHTFMVTRANNGRINLTKPISNIKWVKVSNVIFKHGPKKKMRKNKKKKHDNSDDDSDVPFENGNPDLIDATYISIKVNDFIRGTTYDVDGRAVNQYTVRIFNSIDDRSGEGDWDGGPTIWNEIHDWDASGDSVKKIDEIIIDVTTDINPSPVHINFEIEIEFGIAN